MSVGLPRAQASLTTDASIKYVLTETAYEVDVSVDSDQSLSIGVQGVQEKGDTTADIELILLLRSTIGQCEARWKPHPGDANITDHVDTDGDTVADTLLSEIDRTLPDMLPGETRDVARTYTVHCFQKSFHDNAIRFEAGVVPRYPMGEEDPSDNVSKLHIDVTAQEIADVEKLGLIALGPNVGVIGDIAVTLRSVLHNNGPYGDSPYGTPNLVQELVTVTDDIVVTAAPSCLVTPNQILGTAVELPVSVDVVLDQEFTVRCNTPGFHTIDWEDCIEIQNVHVRDPNPDNNCAFLEMVFPGEQAPGPPVVGGVAGLYPGTDTRAADSSSSRTRDYFLPIAGAVAGVILAVAAGGSYARGRWLG